MLSLSLVRLVSGRGLLLGTRDYLGTWDYRPISLPFHRSLLSHSLRFLPHASQPLLACNMQERSALEGLGVRASMQKNWQRQFCCSHSLSLVGAANPDPDIFEKYRDTPPMSIATLLQTYSLSADSSICTSSTTNLNHDTAPNCIAILFAEILGPGVVGSCLLLFSQFIVIVCSAQSQTRSVECRESLSS